MRGMAMHSKKMLVVLFMIVIASSLVMATTNVSDCQILNNVSDTYVLQNDVEVTGGQTCFLINATGITFDMNGYTVENKYAGAANKVFSATSIRPANFLVENGHYLINSTSSTFSGQFIWANDATYLTSQNITVDYVEGVQDGGQYHYAYGTGSSNQYAANQYAYNVTGRMYNGEFMRMEHSAFSESVYEVVDSQINFTTSGSVIYITPVNSVSGVLIQDSTFYNAGVHVQGSSGSTSSIVDSYFYNIPLNMYFYGTSGTATLTGNYINGTNAIVNFAGGISADVQGNTILVNVTDTSTGVSTKYWNNYIGGTATFSGGTKSLNTTEQVGTRPNSYPGSNIGGNYWADYETACLDQDQDNFCDDPVNVSGAIDYLAYTDNPVILVVTEDSPGNGTQVTDVNTNFTFNVTGSNAQTCTLYLDSIAKDTVVLSGDGQYVMSNATYLESINYDGSDHAWYIDCNGTASGVFNFTVKDTGYEYITTDCRALDAAGTYWMTNNIGQTTGNCMIISAGNVTLDGRGYNLGQSYTTSGANIYVNSALDNIEILNMTVYNAQNAGVFVASGNENVTMHDIIFTGTGGYTADINSGIELYDSSSSSIYLSIHVNAQNIYIHDNIFTNIYEDGIWFRSNTGNITLVNNTFKIRTSSATRMIRWDQNTGAASHVYGNTFNQTRDAPLFYRSSGTFDENVYVYNNYFDVVNIDNVAQGISALRMFMNTTKQVGTPIYGGNGYIGGNWYDGISNTSSCFDTDNDGLCEQTVNVSGLYDYLPLTGSYSPVPELTNDVCAALFYPNEDDAPTEAEFPVNFTVFAPLGFDSPVVNIVLSYGGDDYSAETCSYNETDSTHREYNCTVQMHYYYAPGDYDLEINYSDQGYSSVATQSGTCTYGQLVASETTTSYVGFSDAAPGVENARSDDPVNIRNTGNVDLDLRMTAYDLTGRTTPATKLNANTFKAGEILGSAVTLADSTATNVSVTLQYGQGNDADIYLWLSMPLNQLVQDYYAATPWQLTGVSS